MQLKNTDMVNNRVKVAQFKLNQHRNLGSKSTLSVYEVAKLMDTIKREEQGDKSNSQSIFFSLN